jgi:ATP synthase protein I
MAKTDSPMRALGTVGSVGLSFVIAIVLGWWFGATLDRWMGTGPWCTFVFFALGVVAGGLNVFRTVGAMGAKHGDGGA